MLDVPPPINGMAVVSQRAVEHFRPWGQRMLCFSKPPWLPDRAWPVYRQVRFALDLAALPLAKMRGVTTVYLVPDSDRGHPRLLYTLAVVRALRLRAVLHHHVSSYLNDPHPTVARALKLGGPNVDHIVLCQRAGRLLQAAYGVDSSRIHAVANTFVLEASSPTPPATARPSRPLRVGMLSNLTPEKGVDTFLRTAERLASHDVEFLIAGPVGDPHLEERLSRLPEDGGISYVGALYDAEKDEFLRSLDIFLFPTRYRNEAQPLVLFEALAAGAVPLATAMGCIEEQIDGVGLTIVDDVDAAAAIERLTRDREELAALRASHLESATQPTWRDQMASVLVPSSSPPR